MDKNNDFLHTHNREGRRKKHFIEFILSTGKIKLGLSVSYL